PGAFDWDDIGDFAALQELGNASDDGVVWVDADGLARAEDGTTIAVVGLRDVVVVRTSDALLVTTLDLAQRVKEVPALLKETGRDHLV
ncbi:MAG: mannose-1-phosphate guanylyltransferase, partial [Actinomycetales bacterium]